MAMLQSGITLDETSKTESYRWSGVPHWYLWEGGFLLLGRAKGLVPPHSHHAIQIVIALDGKFAICGQHEQWREGHGLIVRADVVHSFDAQGALGAMLFVDPESSEGAWLSTSVTRRHHHRIRSTAGLVHFRDSYIRGAAFREYGDQRAHPPLRACVESWRTSHTPHGPASDHGVELDPSLR